MRKVLQSFKWRKLLEELLHQMVIIYVHAELKRTCALNKLQNHNCHTKILLNLMLILMLMVFFACGLPL